MDSYKYIHKLLKRKATQVRIYFLFNGLAAMATLALVLLGLGLGLILVLPGAGIVLFGFSLLSWALLLGALLTVLYYVIRPLTPDKMAVILEGRYPDLNSELISAIQLGRQRPFLVKTLGLSEGMIEALLEKMEDRLQSLVKRPLVNRRLAVVNLIVLSVLFLSNIGAFHFSGGKYADVLSLIADPFQFSPFTRINLEVTPGNVRILEGDSLTVQARFRGQPSGEVFLEIGSRDAGGRIRSMEMQRETPFDFSRTIEKIIGPLEYRVFHRRAASPWYRIEVSDVPRIGDISLKLDFPSYTGLESQQQKDWGHIKCLKGTVVQWRARANKPVAEASLVMGSGEVYPLRIVDDYGVHGEFVVIGGGRYQIRLIDQEGFRNVRPDEYDITLWPDEFPVVELLTPQQDLELDRAAMVEIYFTARDDYGLMVSSLVYQVVGGASGRLTISDAGGRKIHQSDYSWDLGAMGLSPGDRVDYHVEVLDNDSISGPKAGVSLINSIRIKDSEAMHEELSELEEELIDDLIELLGDELAVYDRMMEAKDQSEMSEKDFLDSLEGLYLNQEGATERFAETMQKMEEYLKRLAEDVLTDPSTLYMKGLSRRMLDEVFEGEEFERDQLADLAQDEEMSRSDREAELSWMATEKDKRIGRMEQAINLLEDSSKYQNMKESLNLQEDILDRQMDLVDRLDEMSGNLTGEAMEELSEMIQEIAQMLSKLMESLTSMAEELPEEFINADALQDLPFKDIFETMKEMAKALSQGDFETARQKAEELLKELGDMMQRLQEASRNFEDFFNQSYQEFNENKRNELAELVKEQRQILEETERMASILEQRLNEKLKNEMEEFQRKAEKDSQEIEGKLREVKLEMEGRKEPSPSINPRALSSMLKKAEDLRRQVAQDSGDSYESTLKSLKEDVESQIKEAQKEKDTPSPGDSTGQRFDRIRELLEGIEEALPDRSVSAELSPLEKHHLENLSQQQAVLGNRSRELAEKIDAISKVLPIIPPELAENLEEASLFMDDAQKKLGNHQARLALPPEREALYRLQKAQNAANQASSQMGQMAGLRSRGQGGLMEVGQMFGLLLPTPSLSPSMGETEHGRSGISVRNFKIPGKEEFEVPKIIREEIMESIRSGYPAGFEKAIKEYYRRISE